MGERKNRSGWRGWWWLLGALAVVAAVVAYVRITSVKVVDGALVERSEVRAYVEEQAKTRLADVYRITMPIDGRIEPITLREGDAVATGQVVARVEPDDLSFRIDQARARVAKLKSQIVRNDDERLERTMIEQINAFLVSLDRTVDAAEENTRAGTARHEFFTSELARVRTAHEQGAASATELSRARLEQIESDVDLKTAFLTLRSVEAVRVAARIAPRLVEQTIELKALSRDVLEDELDEAEARLAALVRDRRRLEITSPIDGVVLERLISNKRELTAGTELMHIGTMDDLEIEVELLSQDAALVDEGDEVQIWGAAIGAEPARGVVRRIYPQGFKKISSLGVEQQRVLVIVGFEEGEPARLASEGRRIGPAYRVQTRIITQTRGGVLRVPRTAVFRAMNGQWRAFVVRGGRARTIEVGIGLANDREVEITSGLEEGDRVIVAPESDLVEGDRVRVVEG